MLFWFQRKLEQEIEEAEQRHETRKRKIFESSEKFQEEIKKVCGTICVIYFIRINRPKLASNNYPRIRETGKRTLYTLFIYLL